MAEPKIPKMVVIAGDQNQFYVQYMKFKDENKIIEKHISSMIGQMPNPMFVKGVTGASQPEFIPGVVVSAVIFYYEKPSVIRKPE